MHLLLLALVASALGAAEFTPPPEAAKAFAAQGKGQPAAAVPAVVGAWVWSGRADAQYKPFFEWDLRLAAGKAELTGLKAKLATLGPKQETLREGAWVELGAIRAGATRDVALRLNCPTFAGWKLELAWQGGGDTWIGADRSGLPIPLTGSADQAIVVAVGADAEPNKGGKGATATWNLWNLGGKPATGVTQIVRLRSEAGAVVATGELAMAKDDSVPAHASKPYKLVLGKAPAWASVGVETRMPDAPGGGGNVLTPPRGDGPDLVVEKIVVEGEDLIATVANRLGKPLAGATITVSFANAGKPAKDASFAIAALADGATATSTAHVGKLPAWDEYSITWKPTK